jgi:hypothetical protein
MRIGNSMKQHAVLNVGSNSGNTERPVNNRLCQGQREHTNRDYVLDLILTCTCGGEWTTGAG